MVDGLYMILYHTSFGSFWMLPSDWSIQQSSVQSISPSGVVHASFKFWKVTRWPTYAHFCAKISESNYILLSTARNIYGIISYYKYLQICRCLSVHLLQWNEIMTGITQGDSISLRPSLRSTLHEKHTWSRSGAETSVYGSRLERADVLLDISIIFYISTFS